MVSGRLARLVRVFSLFFLRCAVAGLRLYGVVSKSVRCRGSVTGPVGVVFFPGRGCVA